MLCQGFLKISILFLLYAVLYVADLAEKKKEVYFAKKFTGGHFDISGRASDVDSYVQCASLCLASRPQCQSFNLKWQKNKTKAYSCQILNAVPKLLTAEAFKVEEKTSYYELVYSETMVSFQCKADDGICKNDPICFTSVVRTCADQNTGNCSLTDIVYCITIHVKAMNWDAAKGRCDLLGGQLAEDRDPNKHKVLLSMIQDLRNKFGYGDNVTWIGGYGIWTGNGEKTNKTWHWQDGSNILREQTHWQISDPNNLEERNCIALTNFNLVEGGWLDKPCNITAPFFCETWIPNRY